MKAEILAKMDMKSEAELLAWLRAHSDEYRWQSCIGIVYSVNWAMLSSLQEPIPSGDVLAWLQATDGYNHQMCIDFTYVVDWEALKNLILLETLN